MLNIAKLQSRSILGHTKKFQFTHLENLDLELIRAVYRSSFQVSLVIHDNQSLPGGLDQLFLLNLLATPRTT